MTVRAKHYLSATVIGIILPGLAACQQEKAGPPPPVRIVRTITVEKQPQLPNASFTGYVEAQDRAALSFRIGGRMAERTVGVGSTVRQGELVARLDPENELNDLRSARAALTAAQGFLRKAENHLQRQSHLLARNVTTRADFELAEQARTAARAQVDAAQARVTSAEDIVGFTTLKADAPGLVTGVGAEPGEVVSPGHMIVQLARREGRDAVFEVPADVVRSLTPNTPVRVALSSDPSVTASGRVREIAPQADPVTRTFQIRVGLSDPPQAFRLGSTVSGTITGSDQSVIAIPSTALSQHGQELGVWIVDPEKLTVSLRNIEVMSADPATAVVGNGLSPGDIVVTAGVSQLRDGQQVRLTGTEMR
ncbi:MULTISPECIES: efflux RND transporter periplasmic adaptor subunit [unclassified Chelatococcus]|uniref:efflux RND transporter periplasmic adaptor subunit n=1 Tax=unclassified Chelatococcus TaxID=2638111 RepID=UPI001BCFE649|nr:MULTISPECIES: efflux RND transporter periplasmic adaptor subunit [unclassified Chelatococcus]MBS7699419.1 efflux RND transporter periplasmic adaptor subunit [Chelatococcus sp. YT9]MBX3557689.1 efflux RND transporter periplasmic adaptor subunit [Chelatococcus sp.]